MACMFYFARCVNIIFNSLVKYGVHTTRKIKFITRHLLSHIIVLYKSSVNFSVRLRHRQTMTLMWWRHAGRCLQVDAVADSVVTRRWLSTGWDRCAPWYRVHLLYSAPQSAATELHRVEAAQRARIYPGGCPCAAWWWRTAPPYPPPVQFLDWMK